MGLFDLLEDIISLPVDLARDAVKVVTLSDKESSVKKRLVDIKEDAEGIIYDDGE